MCVKECGWIFNFGFCLSIFFYCCDKTPPPRQLIKEIVYLGLTVSELGSITIMAGSVAADGQAWHWNRAESLHLDLQARGGESWLGMGCCFVSFPLFCFFFSRWGFTVWPWLSWNSHCRHSLLVLNSGIFLCLPPDCCDVLGWENTSLNPSLPFYCSCMAFMKGLWPFNPPLGAHGGLKENSM